MENTNSTETKRPTFLTVLCILTFIGVAISLYSSLTGYFEAKEKAAAGVSISQEIDQALENADNVDQAEMGPTKDMIKGVTDKLDYGKMATGNLLGGGLNIIILAGALLMWRLKKSGFYIYTAAQLAQVGVSFWSLGGGALGGAVGIVVALLALLFIILYGLNLKHMH